MKKQIIKKAVGVLFIIYCLCLIYVLFLPNLHRMGYSFYSMYNITPFKTIFEYFTLLKNNQINTDIVIRNIGVNLLLFLPMGFAMPILFGKKINSIGRFACFIVLITLLVEIIQFLTKTGTGDIDDVILNSVGGIIGYFFGSIINGFFER